MTLWKRANSVIPGGVNSPVRSFAQMGIEPLFIQNAQGARVEDRQGNTYIDYVNSWGALIFGHAFPPIVDAVQRQTVKGTSYGLATELEVEFAENLVKAVPSLEMVRLVNSGTEATMSALRLARGYTGRQKIVKFSGCYHGHSNDLLVAAGSGAITFGVPDSAGVTQGAAGDTIILPFNELGPVEIVLQQMGSEIAAIIVEPIAGNMGLIPPVDGFLNGIRSLTQKSGALLIFDEVITGFRVARGGAQALYNVIPDLTCLGKIIGGGFPIGAYGGRREIMERLSPLGPVYQAGTLSGNPVAVSAGLEVLRCLEGRVYSALLEHGELLRSGLQQAARANGIPVRVTGVGSLTGIFFSKETIRNAEDLKYHDAHLYARFFKMALAQGLLFPPSPFEAVFISTAHTREILNETMERLEKVFALI